MIGTRVGPYEVSAKLGEGGMGEVWRARDTKLERDVAIKVLPASFVADPERLARFEREAKLLAQLNHPNIAHIYGMETSGEAHALVMELVEGPTLAERLEQGALPLDESLSLARQIAEALEAAHEKGIVHRDLKPQNVKVASEGKVKVLDFGLAKAREPAASSSGGAPTASPTLMHSPTLTAAGTQLGVILGTAAYMAPEQAKGFAVDKRADIWAFGVVLFEMLTGRTLFTGDSVADTLARVLQRDVDFDALPASTPPAIRRLLRRCLERNPKNRLHDIADARLVIDDALAGRGEERPAVETAAPGAAPLRHHLAWLAALVVAIAGTAFVARGAGRVAAPPREPQHLAIQLPPEQELAVGTNALISFSPDGRALLFSAVVGGRRGLYRRELGAAEARPILGTEDGVMAFFSPDGKWIGFSARSQLLKVPVEGGRPIPLGEMRGAGGATWLADGSIVTAPFYSDGLFRISGEGGELRRLTTPDREDGVLGHWWPQELPGGRWVLFTAFRTPVDESRVGAVDLESGEVRWLVEGGFFGHYAPTGQLLYAKAQRLYAAPFDAGSLRVTGPAVPVLEDLLVEQTGGYAAFALSSRGTLAYLRESIGHPAHQLVWLDRSGRATPAGVEWKRFLSVDLSGDDRRAALTVHGESRDLWMLALDRGTLSRLTSGADTEFDPQWLRPDDRELVYVVDRPPFELHRIAVGTPDGGRALWSERPELDTTAPSPSPEGRWLVYCVSEAETGINLYVRPLDGSEPPRPFRVARGEDIYPSFSPDGRFVAYQSDETGRPEVYVQAFPGPGERVQITADGGREPLWAGDGEIFFRHDDELRAVATRTTARGFEFDAPQTLFEYPLLQYALGGGGGSRLYDVTRDGRRLLAISVPEELRPRQIEVVTDWAAALERRLAATGR